MNQANRVTKISRRPVVNPNFTHQFESLRIKLKNAFFFNPLVFFVFFPILMLFSMYLTQCSLIGKNSLTTISWTPGPNPNFTHQLMSLVIQLEMQ